MLPNRTLVVRKSADPGKTLRIEFGKEKAKNTSKQPYIKASDTQCNLGVALLKKEKNFFVQASAFFIF